MATKIYEFFVIGIEHISYINKVGRQIEGNKLYLINQLREVDVGQACEDVFINSNVNISGIRPDCECNLIYNRYGAVVGIDLKSD